MGNVALWKPASTSVLSNYFVMKVLEEAGLPPGVIQFLPGDGAEVGDPALNHRDLAGVHFTGSTATFNNLWATLGGKIGSYRSYPRIVGETGGKDFIFAHASADVAALATAIVRGAYEYQGQKCSAASRAYIPKSLWPKLYRRSKAEPPRQDYRRRGLERRHRLFHRAHPN
jgi:1-pyrroline-5-carboxylate dehydrogenase